METTHGELQIHHNKAIREDSIYRIEGLLDVRMEEMADHIPTQIEAPEVVAPQEPWAASQWDIINQLRLGFGYLNRSFATLEKEVKERTSKKGRYKDYG